MADDVNIKIGADADGAKTSIKDLEKTTEKSFDKMSDAAKKESKEVSDAFRKSGLRMEKDIKKSSEDAKKNYLKIKNSGTASANDIKRAHSVMTAKIKKNNRELSAGNGLLSKSFKLLKSNLLAVTVGVAAAGLAIKRAFSFAETAAQLKAQRLAFKNYTESLGVDSDILLKKLKEVSRGTVAEADLVSSAGKALLLGIDPTKTVKLLEIARASAKITGESLTQLFEDVAKGTGRASKLILDNLGIQFSQGEATRRMAEALGVQRDELTANQIAQGNLNEVIRQGQPIIDRVGKDFTSQADVLAKLKARYIDITVIIGQKLLKAMPKLEIATLKTARVFLVLFKALSQISKINARFLDFVGVTTNQTERANHGIDNLTKGIDALGKKILGAEAVLAQLNKAETENIDNSKKIIAAAKERIDLREEEEGLINKNLEAETNAINTAAELQKVQNAALKKSISETKEELRELESEARRAADFAQTIAEEIEASQKRRAQAGFDPLEKLVDDLNRAEELFKQASEERAAGNIDRARDLTLTAVKAANAILEVQKGAEEESGVSRTELNKATFAAEKLVKSAAGFAEEMKTASAEAIPGVEKGLADMEAQLELGKATVSGVKDAIDAATQAANVLKNKLSENTTATHTQIINTIKNDGVGPPGFKTGVHLPGYGGGDKIHAMLEAGEDVIRKESVRKLQGLGKGAMNAIHSGDIQGLVNSLPLPGFAEGRQTEQKSSSSSVNVNLELGGQTFPMSSSENTADEFVKTIKTINVVRGRRKTVF